MVIGINELWHWGAPDDWDAALQRYWDFVQPQNLELESELAEISLDFLRGLDANAWYEFLLDKYFRWKYTAPNRYASTTKQLKKYQQLGQLVVLDRIRESIISLPPDQIHRGLSTVCRIQGLGTAGASGLLSLIHPEHFGTVDQFVVKALRDVDGLSHRRSIAVMNEMLLTIDDAVLLISIMQSKSAELNSTFGSHAWTPRKIDMVLWTYGRNGTNRAELDPPLRWSESDQKLLNAVREVLHYIWDPIGVAGVPAARDEYDPCAGRAFEALSSGVPEHQLFNVLSDMARQLVCHSDAERARRAAAALCAWREHLSGRRTFA